MSYGVQHDDGQIRVKVNGGQNAAGVPQSDFIIVDQAHPGEHLHVVIDEYGNQVYNEFNQNH